MHSTRYLSLYLGLLTALSALSLDMSLPALPQLNDDFAVSAAVSQLTLSAFLVGYGSCQLIYGPVSDVWGRRPALLAGLALFVVGGAACATAQSIEMLIFWRFVQGVGACAGPVLARAIVRDKFTGAEAAAMLSTVTFVIGLAPLLAPGLGAGLLLVADWRAIYWALTVIGAVMLAATFWRYDESAPSWGDGRSWSVAGWATAAAAPFRHPDCWRPVLVLSGCYCGLMLYVGGAPLILIDLYGVSPTGFAGVFALTGSALMAGAMTNRRLTPRYGAPWALLWAGRLALSAGAVMIAAGLAAPMQPWTVALPMCLFTFAAGVLLPNATASALALFPHIAGTVSASLGTVQVMGGALAAYLVSLIYTAGAPALGAGLLVCALPCLLLRREGKS